MKIQFDKNFIFGVATSAPQLEGDMKDGKSQSVWDYWFEKDPKAFYEQDFVLDDFRYRYKEIIDKGAEIGINSIRTSIQWTRFMPDGKSVSAEAKKYYRQLFEYMISKKITPMINLFHFDVPMWLHKEGGFENKIAIEKFRFYAQKAFESFGDIVKTWFTFNEPVVPVEMGYLNVYHLPQVVNLKRAMQVLHNYIMSHLAAVKTFKQIIKDGEIGIVLNVTPTYPKSNLKEDIEAAKWSDMFQSKVILEMVVNKKYPQLIINHAKKNGYMWEITSEEQTLIADKSKMDILAINYYAPKRVQSPLNKPNKFNPLGKPEGQLFDLYSWPDAVINKHRGWEVYPQAIYDLLKNIQENYDNIKTFVSENGIGVQGENRFKEDGKINDDYRINFIKDHLYWVHKAIREGSSCFGYHLWTMVDNWSWLNAYKNRYGLIEFNKRNKKFVIKKSGEWYKKLNKTKSFDYFK